MIIAIDIDGMLDRFGDFFQISIPAWQKAGTKVGIITGRPDSNKEHIAKILEKVGIKMDFLLFKPDIFQDMNLPNGIWKGVLCRMMKVDILFDDLEHNDPVVITDFAQVAERTQILTPINYLMKPDAEGATTQDYVQQMIDTLKDKAKG